MRLLPLLALLFTTAVAQPGTLDPAFGDSGISAFNVGVSGSESGTDAVPLPDGGLVVAGVSSSAITLARFTPEGHLDPAFGEGGTTRTPVLWSSQAERIATTPDGGIIVAGLAREREGDQQSILVRYLSDGRLDPTFGEAGVRTVSFGSGRTRVSGLAALPDGRYYLTGYTTTGNDDETVFLARLLSDGTVDTSFGTSGVVWADVGERDIATDLAVQPDGAIVVCGVALDIDSQSLFTLLRFQPDGAPDPSFGEEGVVTADLGFAARRIAIDGAGRIVAGGGLFSFARFDEDGTLDPTFGDDGITTLDISPDRDLLRDLTLVEGDRIAAAGYIDLSSGGFRVLLALLTPDGLLDDSFGDGGVVVSDGPTSRRDRGQAVTVHPGNRLVVSGSSGAVDFSFSYSSIMALAYTASGTPDLSFGEDGRALALGLAPGDDRANAVALDAEGTIYVASEAWVRTSLDFTVARLDAAGRIDPTFGVDGFATDEVQPGWHERAQSVHPLPDGGVLALIEARPPGVSNRDIVLARYDADGNLDGTWGTDGFVRFAFGSGNDLPRGFVVDPDGAVTVAASTFLDPWHIGLVRFLPDGSLDSDFGINGTITTQTGGAYLANDITSLPGGDLIVAATASDQSATDIAVLRYTPTGERVTSFGRGGIAYADFGIDRYDRAIAVAIQSDGRIVVLGESDTGSDSELVLARFTPDGDLDPSFGEGGRAAIPLGDLKGFWSDLVLQPAGGLLVVGSSFGETTGRDLTVLRIDSAGALDETFGEGGLARIVVSPEADYGSAAALQPDGLLLVAGGALQQYTDDSFLARFVTGIAVSDAPAPSVLSGFSLSAPHPNPASGRSTLTLRIEQDRERVVAEVYDVLGRRISVLHDGPLTPGEHRLTLDATDLPSGTYVVRVAGGEFDLSRRVTLVR